MNAANILKPSLANGEIQLIGTTYGARPLRRAIQSMVEDAVAEKMLEGEWYHNFSLKIW